MAISKMTDLMDDLLTLGKLTSGKVSHKPESFDVVKFCNNLVQEFNVIQVDGRSIDFIVLAGFLKLVPKEIIEHVSDILTKDLNELRDDITCLGINLPN